jgi:hypothetical protein
VANTANDSALVTRRRGAPSLPTVKGREDQRKFPKTAKPLEVAGFFWERERLEGYREPPPWKAWFERWNEEHPGHRFESYSHFRMYFLRGDAAVKELNFGWPEFRFGTFEVK